MPKANVKRGRPRRAARASEERLVARCSSAELKAVKAAAEKCGESLSEFVRTAALQRAQVPPGRYSAE